MKMKYLALALATCLLALLMTLSIGATDVTVPETIAETTAETVTAEEMATEPTETAAESESDGDADGLAFRPDTLKNTLPIMGMGMLGIFLVTGVIVLVIMLLNWISNSVEKRKGGEDGE